jgi:outer membrane protein OmpA-like peptidoglycan-associated protein
VRVGAAHEPAERQADLMADAVMRGHTDWAPPELPPVDRSKKVRRACAACATSAPYACASCEEAKLRRSVAGGGFDNAAAPSSVMDVVSGSGRPLAAPTRAWLEPRFGFDFGRVRIHDDAAAAGSAAQIGARAYTLGPHIVFGAGQFAPSRADGMRLLAHELAHVVQQEGGGAPLVRRQPEDELPPPQDRANDLLNDNPLITKPVTEPAEATCPKPPTHLGNVQPSPPCSSDLPETDGPTFRFCKDADTLIASERARLRTLAASLDSGTTFEVHGYASKDAPGATQLEREQYNLNLSCHRAKRVARELVNGGVLESKIQVGAHGGTERFGTGESNRDDRVVQLHHVAPGRQTPGSANNPTRDQLPDVVEAAKQRLIRGEYHVSADAYVQRWSCGHFHTLAEVVERSTIEIDRRISLDEQGSIGTVGVNTIVISDKIADTDNMSECAANRIADLAFHHLARPNVPFSGDQHRMALHLLSLAGIDSCRVHDIVTQKQREFDTPLPADPQAGQAPLCATDPLPGATSSKELAQGVAHPPPTFTLSRPLQVDTQVSPLQVQSDGLQMSVDPPDDALLVSGVASVSGDTSEIQNWQVGLLQTVESANTFVQYASGGKIRERLPLPLRDGPRADNARSRPPWFDLDAQQDAQPGNVPVQLQDSPNLPNFAFFVDLNRIKLVESQQLDPTDRNKGAIETPTFGPAGGSVPDTRDVASHGHREIVFNTWLAARRKDAPLSRFSTTFIAGKKIAYHLDFDFVFRGIRNPGGSGSLSITATDATDADTSTMQLRGATPADFTRPGQPSLFNEFLVSEAPPSIGQAGGITSLLDLPRKVQQLVTPIRNRLGFKQPLTLLIKFQLSTGEIILDTRMLAAGAVVAQNDDNTRPKLTDSELRLLAQEVFFALRGKLIIGRLSPSQGTTGSMRLSFAQLGLP